MKCIDCGIEVNKKRVRRCEACEITRRTKLCEHCKETFVDKTSKINKIFCSRECVNLNMKGKVSKKRTGMDIPCEVCGNLFYKRLNSSQRTCSMQCGVMIKPIPTKKGFNNKCNVCSKEYYVPLCHKDSKYCSKECADIGQQCTKIPFKCKMCKNIFEVYPSRLKQQTDRGEQIQYCSQKCRDLDPIRTEMLIKMNENQSKNKKLNKLELAGNSILEDLFIEYDSQYLVAKKFLVDIFIVKYNIVIQWDGDYWHGHPTKLKDGIPDKRQQKRMNFDKSQDNYMSKMGITVLRFWEHDVYKNKGKIIDIIRNTIQSTTS
ncbi:MAG: hypothetical protein DRH57_01525 [Candidatus Cloacimonadota bacterium]|nr:MAG: hypothetical protein DRH57_01525 [Candidatus Cloacimonadota bacterium]